MILEALQKGQIPLYKSEIWSSSLDGKDQKLIASGPFYRVMGISLNQKHLYVTRLIEGSWQLQGFSLIDLDSGKMTNVWPAEEKSNPYYYDMRLITMPDGTSRILYTYAEQGLGTTVLGKMPTVYLGDPETQKEQVIWSGKNNGQLPPENGYTGYEAPAQIAWAPDGRNRFIYNLKTVGELWQSDLDTGVEKKLGKVDGELIAWTAQGIVIRNQYSGVLKLMDDQGITTGVILLPPKH